MTIKQFVGTVIIMYRYLIWYYKYQTTKCRHLKEFVKYTKDMLNSNEKTAKKYGCKE